MLMKIKTKKNIKKQLDVLWSLIVRQSNNGNCEICQKPAQNSHHIIGRSNYALRWNIKNGTNLCISCHLFGQNSAHKNPIFFINWFKSKRPSDYEYLKDPKFTKTKTWTIFDYQEILKTLKEIYAQLEV